MIIYKYANYICKLRKRLFEAFYTFIFVNVVVEINYCSIWHYFFINITSPDKKFLLQTKFDILNTFI
jgi:hypothetical protein